MFGAQISGSGQQAVRSGVFLAIARPQPPPEKRPPELVSESAS